MLKPYPALTSQFPRKLCDGKNGGDLEILKQEREKVKAQYSN